MRIIRRIIVACSVCLFFLALTQPCYCTSGCVNPVLVVLLGWLGMMVDLGSVVDWMAALLDHTSPALPAAVGASFTWLANPLLCLSWTLLKANPKGAIGASLMATALSMSFLLFDEVISDEAGNYSPITQYKLGYWLWVVSCLTMLTGSLLLTYTGKNRSQALLN